ncbi:44373_t:CDS:2 [Gigaspora margarita]|uniref:44373_t:CDS:1 n=1 Tax=Gigaspora margarita TaxID=4874 RepID=A0ABN7W5U4_GIGMA|nr:44373_t:CDS:2 [Gigaspora margarita]
MSSNTSFVINKNAKPASKVSDVLEKMHALLEFMVNRIHQHKTDNPYVIDDNNAYTHYFYYFSGSKDGEVDIYMNIYGIKFVVQCKNWIKEIGI